MRSRTLLTLILAVLGFSCTSAQEGDDESPDGLEAFNGQPMTAERLGELILSIDDKATLDLISHNPYCSSKTTFLARRQKIRFRRTVGIMRNEVAHVTNINIGCTGFLLHLSAGR